jgi:hypothetical protein
MRELIIMTVMVVTTVTMIIAPASLYFFLYLQVVLRCKIKKDEENAKWMNYSRMSTRKATFYTLSAGDNVHL